jgi:methylenetetrahydrofolate dehydrogenase (NADP+)/methenyltetrahydrofolate cyclohydrolase
MEALMILIDGKATAAKIREELTGEIGDLTQKHGRPPGLAVILVGEDPASQVYVRNKEKACAQIGVASFPHRPSADTSQDDLEVLIKKMNADPKVDGILLQLPLPKSLDSRRCLDLIDPSKDVDGFQPVNVGRLALGLPCLRSCTPAGVMRLLEEYDLKTSGKKAVVIGRSNIVGRPLSIMLSQYGDFSNATVTLCHSRTPDLPAACREADFLFAAIGRAKFVTKDFVKPGAVVIDVGMNRDEEGKLCGDVDFEDVKDMVTAITPVPGGVGPMTIAQLMVNTVEAYKAHVGA